MFGELWVGSGPVNCCETEWTIDSCTCCGPDFPLILYLHCNSINASCLDIDICIALNFLLLGFRKAPNLTQVPLSLVNLPPNPPPKNCDFHVLLLCSESTKHLGFCTSWGGKKVLLFLILPAAHSSKSILTFQDERLLLWGAEEKCLFLVVHDCEYLLPVVTKKQSKNSRSVVRGAALLVLTTAHLVYIKSM